MKEWYAKLFCQEHSNINILTSAEKWDFQAVSIYILYPAEVYFLL